MVYRVLMIVTNEIKGEGNGFQQDRAGSLEIISETGVPLKLLWVADGHGKYINGRKYDLGGMVAQRAHDILNGTESEIVLRLFEDTEFGKEFYAHMQSEIKLSYETFMVKKGWRKLKEVDGKEIDVLWTNSVGRIITSAGGTTLIITVCAKIDDVWQGRMYNVGDSMMILNDTVYSQAGIDGLNDKTVMKLAAREIKTIYSRVPGDGFTTCHNFHKISPTDKSISINSPPTPIFGKHRYYISNVRGEIAAEVTTTYTPKMFNLEDSPSYPMSRHFSLDTNLASWSNMGDMQNDTWASIPSYSKKFVIDGPLTLTSDGIGDILKSEESVTDEEKAGWFNYYDDHPMKTYDSSTCSIFKNSWFHKTFMENLSAVDGVASSSFHEDPFYRVAKKTFGAADNICRVTFIP